MPRGYKVPYRKLPGAISKQGQPSSTLRSPPSPPPSCNPHFLLTEYAHSWEGDTLYVACTTDVNVHLYLRWTATPMGMHNRVTTLGGYSFMTDPKYCLVEYNEVEQNEPGDTLSHTFNFAGWAECEWRWWYIVGTVGGEPSPSASCIFQAHYLDQEEAESLKHTDLIEKEVAGVIDHADQSVTPEKLAPFSTLALYRAGSKLLPVPSAFIDFSDLDPNYCYLLLTGVVLTSISDAVILARFNNDSDPLYYSQRRWQQDAVTGAAFLRLQTAARIGNVYGDVPTDINVDIHFRPPHTPPPSVRYLYQSGSGGGEAIGGGTQHTQFTEDGQGSFNKSILLDSIRVFPSSGTFLTGSELTLFAFKPA